MRNGYTTGACAAAAAKAAAVFALTGEAQEKITLDLPDGTTACWTPVQETEGELSGCWKVQKDSGDDPDVTNGIWVYASVREISANGLKEQKTSGKGYWLENHPRLYLNGGWGIGLVTKPGLSCQEGHYAINPVPREMILSAVDAVCQRAGYEDGLMVEIAIPEGAALAEKTFNPRLGIEGGISVLGTTGILRPMSEEALVETIRLDIHMKALENHGLLIMTPGNYGERFLKENLGVALGEAVVCSNFVADALYMVRDLGVGRLLFVGHMGKLVKVAAGAPNTHSRYGDGRMETMEAMTRKALAGKPWDRDPLLCERIRSANTTEEAAKILKDNGLAQRVFDETACAVKWQMEQWSGPCVQTEVIVFSSVHHVVGMTEHAMEFLNRWRTDRKEAQKK